MLKKVIHKGRSEKGVDYSVTAVFFWTRGHGRAAKERLERAYGIR